MKKKLAIIVLLPVLIFAVCVFLFYPNNKKQPKTHNEIPKRIVSLAPNITEILFALRAGDKIVGISNNSDFPVQTEQIAKVGTFWKPDTETIISLKPDLVITLWFQQQKQTAATLESLGYNVLTVKIETIPDLFTAIRQIGEKTSPENLSRNLTGKLKAEINSLQTKYSDYETKKVLWAVQSEPLRAAGCDTFISELIEIAGGENIVPKSLQKYPSLSTEELLMRKPEVIIHSAVVGVEPQKQHETVRSRWEKWKKIPAVKNKRIYIVNPDAVTRLGPRITEGIKIIAQCLHNPDNINPDWKVFGKDNEK
jgi:iron complex transport system substrate-binding protein